MGTAPALAEGTAGVELAGKAEGAIATKLEVLVPWAQGMADREVERLPQEGKRVHELPPEVLPQKGERKPQVLPPMGRRNHDMKLQGSLNKGKREGECPDVLPRKDPKVGALVIWDLGGRPAGEGIVKAKRPIEANKNNAAASSPAKQNKKNLVTRNISWVAPS